MRTKRKPATMNSLRCDIQDWFMRRHNMPVSVDVMLLGSCYIINVHNYTNAKTAFVYRSIRDHICGKFDLSQDQIYIEIK